MEKGWRGLPYNSISDHYKSYFGAKVYKIPVSFASSCPNREGLRGMQTCSFCDVWGSAARTEVLDLALEEQVSYVAPKLKKRFKAEKFLIYFQAYTTTFSQITQLKLAIEKALLIEGVCGIVLGTRPDCLSKSLLDYFAELSERTYLSIELGVQSFFSDDLHFFRRGHSEVESFKAIEKLGAIKSLNLGIHLIFGSPFDSDDRAISTARIANSLPIQNIKLHNLHVLKNTELERLYRAGDFHPIEKLAYALRVQKFIEHIRPSFYLHRLAAYASRWDELVAPSWVNDKMGIHQYLVDHLRQEKSWQSKHYVAQSEAEENYMKVLRQKSEPIPDATIDSMA